MKKVMISLIVVMLLAACAPAAGESVDATAVSALLVTVGESQQSLSMDDLQALPPAEASFKNVAYKGVSIPALLASVGVNPSEIKALKAIAVDGYSVNYDPAQVLKDNVLVAYALADGNPLTVDDGNFRMVLPDEEGKLNARMLAELQVIK